MGYFQNLEIELQEIHDDELREIVAWDHAHRHMLSPEERWRILTNEVLLQRALVLWQNETPPAPKPASEHVALQTRRPRMRQRYVSEATTGRRFIFFVTVLMLLFTAATVTLAVVW
jgi:hypothetical protein